LRLFTTKPAWAEQTRRQAPYLKLAPFLQPGHDEFPEEQAAMKAEAALREAVLAKELPLHESFQGASPLPKSWRNVGPDAATAEFTDSVADVAAQFRAWVDSF